ncbi:MAG TPA: epimerase, partial [Bacteroidota bacterium]
TGMVGEGVLHETLKHGAVESVLVIGRRPCGTAHPKLEEIVHQEFFDYSPIAGQLTGYQACFFCLGVSSVGMKEDDYRRITYDLTLHAATTLSRLNPDMTFCYVSGLGTDENGRSMWARVKGKTESDLRNLPFKAVYAFRPGYIRPTPGLKNSLALSKPLAPFYPLLKAVFPGYVCTLREIGLAMIHCATTGSQKTTLENTDIARLAVMSV